MKPRPRTSAALAGVFTLALLPSLAYASAPAPAQIRAAVARAEHSRDLWATVNICDTKRHPNVIGIRGQMQSLGFASDLQMVITLRYWSFAGRRFEPLPGVKKKIDLGTATHGIHQGGAQFQFAPPAILSGAIAFRWTRPGKVLGRATRQTGHGDKHVDDADPAGYSTATCRIN